MENTAAVFVAGNEYTCKQFYETDTNTDGIDISDALTGEHIGEMFNITIPDMDDPDYDVLFTDFEEKVEYYILSLNY